MSFHYATLHASTVIYLPQISLTARLQPLARSRGEHDGTRKQRARARSEVGLLPAWPPGAMRRFDLAIATSFQLPAGRSRHSIMRSACGITKWCVNAATLRSTLPGHSEVVILTNDGKFAMEECGTARPRVIAFDANLSGTIDGWAARNGYTWKSAERALHLASPRFSAVTLRKWQFVRLIEYRVIFATDPDVDLFFGALPARVAMLSHAWAQGVSAFGRSAVQLVGTGDGQIPVNTGVMLLKPSLEAYQIGLLALRSGRFSSARGWDEAGSPHQLLPAQARSDFGYTRLVRENTWDVVCGNADQGLFTYVFLARLHAYRTSEYCPVASKRHDSRGKCPECPVPTWHFWGGDKPWWLHYTRCPEYFAFLSGVKKSTRCASWLHHRLERAKSLPANWTCGGIKQCVF